MGTYYENPLRRVPRKFSDVVGAKARAKRELGQLFADNWENLVKRAKELGDIRMLPKHKVESGQLWLFPEIEADTPTEPIQRRLREEHGCGYHGCVYATGFPGIVFKITTDPSEAYFIQALADFKMNYEDLPALTEFYAVYELKGALTQNGYPKSAWAIWREESVVAGYNGIERVFYDRRTKKQEEDLRRVRSFLMNDYVIHASFYSKSRMVESLRRLREDALLDGVDMLVPIIDTLGVLADRGLMLADAHYDNIGLVKRLSPWKWWQPVIIDPGHARADGFSLKDYKPSKLDPLYVNEF